MAITHLSPQSVPSDLLPIDTVVQMLKETGRPASKSTVRRWVSRGRLYTERDSAGKTCVPYSDILVAHRDWLDRDCRP